MSHQPLVSEEQFLTANAESELVCFGIAELHVALPQVKRVFEGGRVGFLIPVKRLSILSLQLHAQPCGGNERGIHAYATERESVFG